jgi:three-Cys-motif partner protein
VKKGHVDHTFGGYHTDLKLSMVEQYLKAYAKALSKPVKPFGAKFDLWYIDAFAGTGYRTVDIPEAPQSLFPDETRPAERVLVRGSAQIALDVTPKFDFLVFIEKRPDFAQELSDLSAKHPQRRIQVVNGEANAALQSLLSNNHWNSKRAVLFLDPYGMEVEWATLQAVAKTGAIDVWYLFPLAGFFRQMPKMHDKLDNQKRSALNRIFGTNSWEQVFYPPPVQEHSLLGEPREVRYPRRKAAIWEYEKYAKDRLATIFGAVLNPIRLPREKGTTPRYLLFLCISSKKPRAIQIASDIGNHILRSGSSS